MVLTNHSWASAFSAVGLFSGQILSNFFIKSKADNYKNNTISGYFDSYLLELVANSGISVFLYDFV